MIYDLIIVGGGATGTVAGITAAKRGKKVLILEKNDRILKKVLTTGNGQCNFTNINASFNNYHSVEDDKKAKKIIEKIFENYSPLKVIEFFEDLGIIPIEKKNGKMYPNSLKASSIVDSLRFKLEDLKVEVKTNSECMKIDKKDNFYVFTQNEKFIAKNVLISTGGISSFDVNNSNSIYFITKNTKHTRTTLIPSIVQLKTDKEYVKGLEGIKVEANVSVFDEKNFLDEDKGELLFTTYGISGPTIFNLSYLIPKNRVETLRFDIDFFPNFDYNTIYLLLLKRYEKLKYLTYEEFLSGMLPKKIGQFLMKKIGIEKLDVLVDFSTKDLKKLANILKKYSIKIIETTGFKNAQVTAGGIKLSEIDENLESKYIKGLFLSGEVIDIYGECGGYNLQWCFASAMMIGDRI